MHVRIILALATLAVMTTLRVEAEEQFPITVSPDSCGAAAKSRVEVIAESLKQAGYTRVAVVGFLSEQGSKCAP